ncbi:hypothetical protein ACFV7R_44710 [Streptomyces sp. NPDC059866]|uniref:zinc finger domain-containing protein n=1 Tax=Streptomyces sp. NPDC059866 TaxID=3346978 RepID=UPI003668A8B7
MTPTETARLVALVTAMCPSTHPEETTAQAWHLLLADLDATDAWTAVIRLGRQRHHIAAADIRAEVRAIRNERLARAPLPLPDTDPDDPRRYRAELLAIVDAIASGRRIDRAPVTPADPPPRRSDPKHNVNSKRDLRTRSLRVPCPWCGAAPGGPCVVPRLGIPLRNAPAHEARLIAAGLANSGRERAGKDTETQ